MHDVWYTRVTSELRCKSNPIEKGIKMSKDKVAKQKPASVKATPKAKAEPKAKIAKVVAPKDETKTAEAKAAKQAAAQAKADAKAAKEADAQAKKDAAIKAKADAKAAKEAERNKPWPGPYVGGEAMHGKHRVQITAMDKNIVDVKDKRGREYKLDVKVLVAPPRGAGNDGASVISAAAKARYSPFAAKNGKKGIDNGDEVATKIRSVTLGDLYVLTAKAVKSLKKDAGTIDTVVDTLGEKYGKLNAGMQRMNLGNKLRALYREDGATISKLMQ